MRYMIQSRGKFDTLCYTSRSEAVFQIGGCIVPRDSPVTRRTEYSDANSHVSIPEDIAIAVDTEGRKPLNAQIRLK